jgi:hypothetical protein
MVVGGKGGGEGKVVSMLFVEEFRDGFGGEGIVWFHPGDLLGEETATVEAGLRVLELEPLDEGEGVHVDLNLLGDEGLDGVRDVPQYPPGSLPTCLLPLFLLLQTFLTQR